MTQKKQKLLIPSVDLGGTKIDFAFFTPDKERNIELEFPSTEVVKIKGETDAEKTLKLIAELIRKRTREAEKKGYTVLKLVGMGAPGLYLDDRSVDQRTVPNIPGLAKIKPAEMLENLLGKGWRVFINNDGAVQAVASADAFTRSSDYKKKWAKIVEKSNGRIIYFGPGTGFGAGKIVYKDNHAELMKGSQAFFDILIRNGKTAEDLITGNGLARIAQDIERANLEKGKTIFLKFTEGYNESEKDTDSLIANQLNKISGKVVSDAYYSKDKEARKIAEIILVQSGRDLAKLLILLYNGRGKKSVIDWGKDDWSSVKGTNVFLLAGLLIKPIGKDVILPSTREALKTAGYNEKIYLFEMDQLTIMRNIHERIGLIGASLIIPHKEILKKKQEKSILIGDIRINRLIRDLSIKIHSENKRAAIIAIDGNIGILWQRIIPKIKRMLKKDGVDLFAIEFSSCYKSSKEIDKIIQSFLGNDNTFGRLYSGTLENLLEKKRINELKEKLNHHQKNKIKAPKVILCYGPGVACKPLIGIYDVILYRDITREEITKRYQKGFVVPLGARREEKSRKGQPAYLAGKRLHYIDFPILDKHKKMLQNKIHFYVDDNIVSKPKLVDKKTLDELLSDFAENPFQLKAYHDQGVWGGQWLKRIRGLPNEMINCAWAYELMAYHMSVVIPAGETYIEIPFANVLDKEPERIMGKKVNKRFKGTWPIRINYDDCWKGGDMAIQIHPDSTYIHKQFNESLHQDESYYIMHAAPDAYVHLGLKENVDISEFYDNVRKAEIDGIPFDHREYVNIFPAKEGDLFLIPAGTVHASGKGCVVLELSSTTDRYTLHIYDYLRPDLNGKLREIHSEHAFNMINRYPHRTTPWVKKN